MNDQITEFGREHYDRNIYLLDRYTTALMKKRADIRDPMETITRQWEDERLEFEWQAMADSMRQPDARQGVSLPTTGE